MTGNRHKEAVEYWDVGDLIWFIMFAAIWVPFFLLIRIVVKLKQ